MKELSIQKAKCYDGNHKSYTELINRLEDVKDAIKKQNYGIAMDILCKPYPEYQITASIELKESEDEKIRKALIKYYSFDKDGGSHALDNITPEQIVTWLEKQGEDEYIDPDTLIQQRLDALNDIIADQKLTDKVEPKFKVGDFIVNDYCMGKVIELTNDAYLLDTGQGIPFSCEHNAHLWTIQDAKDGDVLVYGDNPNNHHVEVTMIFKSLRNEKSAFTHFHIFNDELKTDDWSDCGKDAHPATKEQRDLLFQKMKDAGYEWNAEKKELKKIESTNIPENFEKYVEHLLSLSDGEGHSSPAKVKEVSAELFKLAKLEQNPVWSEEDETTRNALINLVEMYYGGCIDKSEKNRLLSWLKSLKDRVQPKQEWSEEDEYYRNIILYCLNNESVGKADKENAIKWFKSLRPQNTWKPSYEQMEALWAATERYLESDNEKVIELRGKVLESLYNDLKKL